jgi:hypothetical protein
MEMWQWNILHSYLKQTKMSFFLTKIGQEGETVPVWAGRYHWEKGGYEEGKCIRGWMWWRYYVLMYESGKCDLFKIQQKQKQTEKNPLLI